MTKNNKKTRHIIIGTDANYLPRAIVFYKSLAKVHNNFVLYIFCFDEIAYKVLRKLKYKNTVPYHTSQFEDAELLKIKASKEKKYEYYWACNPSIGRKVLIEQKVDFIALADCDMMFFQSPEVIFEEFNGADVIIQPNNFSYQYEKDFIPVGYYCTSFQCFRNNKNGKKILNWWRSQCIKWCSANFEKGKFGDQKYLDDWRIRFKKVREVENPGTNVAPWNIQKFDLSKIKGNVIINNKWPLVYYHFHSFRMNLSKGSYILTGDRENNYELPSRAVDLIYKLYIKRMKEAIKTLKNFKEYREYIISNPEGVQRDFSGKVITKYSHS